MDVVDHRKHPCSGLTVEQIEERQPFVKCEEHRKQNEHIYMVARPNASRNVEIKKIEKDTVLVVNIVFGTLHGMKKGTPVHRVHGEIHLRNNCECCCGCQCCGKRRR